MTQYTALTTPLYAGIFAPQTSYESYLIDIMPNYYDEGVDSDLSDTTYDFSDATGGRREIGLHTEEQSEWQAIQSNPSKQARADTVKAFYISTALHAANNIDFTQDASNFGGNPSIHVTYDGKLVSSNYSHKPNAFYPAALATTVSAERDILMQAFKDSHDLARRAEGFAPYSTDYYHQLQERAYGWYFRDIGSLAQSEVIGITSGNHYRTELANMLTHIQAQMNHPFTKNLHMLGTEVWRIMDGRTQNPSWRQGPWQQAYVIMGACHIVQCGFTEWIPVVEWLFQQFNKKISKWGWYSLDTYYTDFQAAYDEWVLQGEPAEFDPYDHMTVNDIFEGVDSGLPAAIATENPPTNRLLDNVVGGVRAAWPVYFEEQMSAMSCMEQIGIAGAATMLQDMVNQWNDRINRGGGGFATTRYRYRIGWRAVTPQLI